MSAVYKIVLKVLVFKSTSLRKSGFLW